MEYAVLPVNALCVLGAPQSEEFQVAVWNLVDPKDYGQDFALLFAIRAGYYSSG